MNSRKILFIVGPTATGKTARGVQCARYFWGEIVSADSRQVYRGMDLGTGKDLEEYDGIKHHLIDIVPAGHKYNLYQFLRDAGAAVDDIRRRGLLPVIVGGTGMYAEALANGIRLPEVPENRSLRAALEGKTLDELTAILMGMKALHNTTDVDTVKRAVRAIEIAEYYREHPSEAINVEPHPLKDAVIVGIDIPREERRKRISRRLAQRLDAGMVDEVKTLLESGVSAESLIYYGLEYKFLTEYIIGLTDYKTMVERLEIAIHRFAKRQMTWFRGMERRGHTIHWLPYDLSEDEFINQVKILLEQ